MKLLCGVHDKSTFIFTLTNENYFQIMPSLHLNSSIKALYTFFCIEYIKTMGLSYYRPFVTAHHSIKEEQSFSLIMNFICHFSFWSSKTISKKCTQVEHVYFFAVVMEFILCDVSMFNYCVFLSFKIAGGKSSASDCVLKI